MVRVHDNSSVATDGDHDEMLLQSAATELRCREGDRGRSRATVSLGLCGQELRADVSLASLREFWRAGSFSSVDADTVLSRPSYRGIFLSDPGETGRDSEFTLHGMANSLYLESGIPSMTQELKVHL